MATWTAADLAVHVLRHIGIVGAGQVASAEDTKVVTDEWASLHPYLRRHQRAPFASGAIEEEFQSPLKRWVGYKVCGAFNVVGPKLQTMREHAEEAWRELGEVSHGERSTLPTRPKYH